MIRSLLLAGTALGLLALACNAAPDIPDDLRPSNSPTRGSKTNADSDSEANNEGEKVLTGGRAPTPTKTNDAGAGTGTTTSDAGGGTGTGTGTVDAGGGTTTTTPPLNNACAGTANQQACFQCCEQQAPGTVQKWDGFWDDCACAPNVCGSVCSQSWCAGFFPNPGDACDNCLAQASNTCSLQADAACKADATCAPLTACDQGSGCASKP